MTLQPQLDSFYPEHLARQERHKVSKEEYANLCEILINREADFLNGSAAEGDTSKHEEAKNGTHDEVIIIVLSVLGYETKDDEAKEGHSYTHLYECIKILPGPLSLIHEYRNA